MAFAIGRNAIVLWTLLTPLGCFYATVKTGDIELPWASIAGFADVLAVMLVAIWLPTGASSDQNYPLHPVAALLLEVSGKVPSGPPKPTW